MKGMKDSSNSAVRKQIEVVAAIIRKDGRIFATQRGYGEFKDWWEFPGGKMKAGERPEEALLREIREELSAAITVDRFLTTVAWDYPQFHLTLHCYLCSLQGPLHLNEHEAARWLSAEELHAVKWLPADEQLLPLIAEELRPASFRPMRRFKQEAAREECISILETAPRGILSVLGDNGYPYGIPLNYVFADGKIYFHCAPEGHKLDAVRAHDKVCFTVLSEPVRNAGEWWNCFTSVICFGRIAVVQDEQRRDALLRALGTKLFPAGYDLEADMARNASRATVLELVIDHISGKKIREK